MSNGANPERLASYFRIGLSQLFFDVLLSPRREGGEGRAAGYQRLLIDR
jgi:hypothetical protein